MIRIVVVDSSAESRSRIVEDLNACFTLDLEEIQFFPRLSIKPLAPEELKFHGAPDICIVGPKMLLEELSGLSHIRRILPNTALLVRCSGMLASLSMVEHLARLGADDILSEQMSPLELLRKLILHARNAARTKSGTLLLVDSGKGGLGTTSVAAALAELAVENGKKTLLVDFDSETQDLSRFLQVRPSLNEHLGALLNQQKPIVQELVEECLQPVWANEPRLSVMTPAVDLDEIYDLKNCALRCLVSIFEILDGLFDLIIVDPGCAHGVLKKTLYRLADQIVFLTNNDPASLFASAERIIDVHSLMSPAARLVVTQNAPQSQGLSSRLVRNELCLATRLDPSSFIEDILPFSKSGMLWPGSGDTLYSRGDRYFARSLRHLAKELAVFSGTSTENPPLSGVLFSFVHQLFSRHTSDRKPCKSTVRSIECASSSILGTDDRKAEQCIPPSTAAGSTALIPIDEGAFTRQNELRPRSSRELISKAQVVQ